MEQVNVKHSKVIIAVFCVAIAVFLLVLGGNLLFESSVTPAGGVPEATGGLSFKSLYGAGSSFLPGGMESRKIAAAFTGKEAEAPRDSVSIMEITVYGDSEEAVITVLKAPDGSLYSSCPDGSMRVAHKAKLQKLLESHQLSSVSADAAPQSLGVNGLAVEPYYYSINIETLFGSSQSDHQAADIQALCSESPAAPVIENAEPTDTITVTKDGSSIFSGTAAELSSFAPEFNGIYEFTLDRVLPSGEIQYRFNIEYSFLPIFSISRIEVPQGGVLLATIDNTNGRSCSVSTNFDYTAGMMTGEDKAWCYIPISHTIPSGAYTVTAVCGDYTKEMPMTVTAESFEEQHLTISEETVSSTKTEEASKEFADAMAEIYKSFDPTTYWLGTFIQPVSGTITTEYGLYRYTNGSEIPTRHAGIDIAAAEGTPVVAPAAGKVIFSAPLITSGNTVVIEHGNGLHSLFFHLQENSCQVGDILQQSDLVGLVGSTGYSSGPHLHYQLMIGDSSINPWTAFDGTAEFYKIRELDLVS